MALRNVYYDFLTVLGILLGRGPLCGPRILQLNISDECNLDCIMCNRSCMGAGGFLDYDKAISIINEIYPLGLQEVYFHGYGEPFLHPRVTDLFRSVRKQHPLLKLFVITNGTCISGDAISEILRRDVHVRFSIHAGDHETWKEIHPEDDASLFGRVKESIRALTRERPSQAEILYVLFKTNIKAIEPMVGLALETGVKRVLFRPMRLYPDRMGRWMNAHLMPTQEEYQTLSKDLAEIKIRYSKTLAIDLTPFLESPFDPGLGRPSSYDYFKDHACYIGSVLTVIATHGQVWGCVEESSVPMGNLQEASFKDIWWSGAYQVFRKERLCSNGTLLHQTDCRSYCQHLGINKKLNDFKRLQMGALLRALWP